MAQVASIAILDGETTPVSHVFAPSKTSDLITTFYGPGQSLIGREQLVITRREPTATVAGKVNLKLVLPTEVTIDGVIQVVMQDLISADLVLSPKGTKQKRKNARMLLSNLLKDAQVAAVVDDFDGLT